jgi:transcriptional regulator with XRE-family HTH domain
VDCHVGTRIRQQRLLTGFSQEELGEALGVTSQQIQKYENGTSRVGAGQLVVIAKVLSVPVSFFFAEQVVARGEKNTPADEQALLATRDGIALARAFIRIENTSLRQALIATAEAAAKGS